jgi:hypothetical protein
MTQSQAYHKRAQCAEQRRVRHARQRRCQKQRERLQREQARAQRALQALEQALVDLGLPTTIAEDMQWRLHAQQCLLGKIVGLMFPPLFSCRSYRELCRVRGWDKNLPGRILGALPKRQWVKRLQRLGQELLVRLWRHVADKSAATRSRWQWTWVGDDSLFKKYGRQLGLVTLGWSGQEQRVRLGIDGLVLVVVIGEGKLVIPVDFAVRRPNPVGPGRPCRDKLTWLQVMLDRTWAALHRRCRRLPPPLVIADSWFGDSKLMAHVATCQGGTLVVEGKSSYAFQLPDGRQVKGQDFLTEANWPWRENEHGPRGRYARLTLTNPTYGRVTVILVDQPGRDRYYLLCRETPLTAPRLIRAWRRRSWIEHTFRTLKHLLVTEACQVQGEDGYYGHLVLRLVAGMVLLYTARVLFKGKVTMEEIGFSLKHHWRFLNSELLELHGLPCDLRGASA